MADFSHMRRAYSSPHWGGESVCAVPPKSGFKYRFKAVEHLEGQVAVRSQSAQQSAGCKLPAVFDF